jgi:hypothetical protein
LEATPAAEYHGLHLEVEHHKRWGIEEGGDLSSSPHWKNKQGEGARATKSKIQLLHHLEELNTTPLLLLVTTSSSSMHIFTLHMTMQIEMTTQ